MKTSTVVFKLLQFFVIPGIAIASVVSSPIMEVSFNVLRFVTVIGFILSMALCFDHRDSVWRITDNILEHGNKPQFVEKIKKTRTRFFPGIAACFLVPTVVMAATGHWIMGSSWFIMWMIAETLTNRVVRRLKSVINEDI